MPKTTFFNLPEEKRDHILKTAVDEFADNNYNNVSISRIVAQAGIAKGSFYQYFEGKEDLFLYLVELAGQQKMAFLRAQHAPDPNAGMFDHIRWLFEVGLKFQLKYPRLAEVGYRALYSDTPLYEDALARIKATASGYYAELIEMGIQQGDVNPNIDKEMAAFMLNNLLTELGFFILMRMELPPEELVKSAHDLTVLDNDIMRETLDNFLNILQFGMGTRECTSDDG